MKRAARRSKSSLAIVERAYRGSLEDQYGHIVWLSQIMRAMGADTALLLKGDCVQFAGNDQARIELRLGDLRLDDLSHPESGVRALLEAEVPVYAWQPDLDRLRLARERLCAGIQPIGYPQMPVLIQRFECIWYW